MKEEFKQGIKDGIPICLGYFSVSMAVGLMAVKAGLPVWTAVLISFSNLTSAGQYAGIGIMAAGGGALELFVTTLTINMRYFLMSLSVSQKVDDKFNIPKRMVASYGITDEVFAVSMQRKKDLSFLYMVGLILTPLLGWTLGTLTGAVAADLLPQIVSNAMGIALYGMFIAIIVPPARENSKVFFVVALAIVASLCFAYIPGIKVLSSGWKIIIIAVFVSGLAAFLFPIKEEANE